MNISQMIYLIEQAKKVDDSITSKTLYTKVDPAVSSKEKEKATSKYHADSRHIARIILEMYKQIRKIYKVDQEPSSNLDRSVVRKFIKEFKHEFLTQMKDSSASINSLIASTLECVPNPGINIGKYIIYLQKSGYFTSVCNYAPKEEEFSADVSVTSLLEHIAAENVIAVPTDKTLRYLENEANISLRENQKTI